MPSRRLRTTFLAAAASLALAAPYAMAADRQVHPSCAAHENSVLPAPEWYAELCLGGRAVRDYSAYTESSDFVPGDLAFYKNNFPAPQNVKTAPLATLAFTIIGPNAQPLFAMEFNNAATVLYAVDNTTRQLGTVDQMTGAFTPIAAISPDPGAAFVILGLAFDNTAGGQAYISMSSGAATGALLFRIDVNTAVMTSVGPITNTAFAIDLAIDSAGQMWSHDIGADTLIRVDKTTGAPTVVGPTGMNANFAQGMMYDHSDDTLYGCAFVIVPAQQGQLVTFNRTTGTALVVAGPIPDELECGVKRAAGGGGCTQPLFSGIQSAVSAGTTACAIDLAWNAAIPCPGTTVKYNVYRSTTPGTPPSAATLLQSCLTTLTYTDTTAISGTRYYYIVRAEDDTTGGPGPCNGGVTDSNLTERSAIPGGPATTTLDDVESGGTNWDTSGGTGTNLWTIVDTQSNSPTHSWFWPDPAIVTLQPLTRTTDFTFGPGGGTWTWFHRFATESTFDGYVAEYSLDGGTTWSDILLGQGSVPANPNRFLANPYNATLSTGFNNPLPGRRAWSGTQNTFVQVIVDMSDFAGLNVKIRWRAGSDNSVSATGIWIDDIALSSVAACSNVPQLAAEPQALIVDAAGNGVYQPNETVIVAPTWRNVGANAIALTGALTNHTGPGTGTYTIPDGAASYGTIAVGGSASCTASGDCYSVANTSTVRPATHWDSTALETVTPTTTPTTKTWTLHIGDSFTDVPASNGFYRFIETILHKNVTGGCTLTEYCPTASTTREAMAVFVLVAKEAAGYTPPPCVLGSEIFLDVPATSGFCPWIEELFRRGVVSGCGGGNYCPTAPASREAMAVFVLRTLDPMLNPPACVPPNLFLDVPETSGFCRWIEELANRGIVTGCGGGNYCPTADVSREQMSVFLAVTFSLVLYGL